MDVEETKEALVLINQIILEISADARLQGREDFKKAVIKVISSCLARDPTLQKLLKQVEDME